LIAFKNLSFIDDQIPAVKRGNGAPDTGCRLLTGYLRYLRDGVEFRRFFFHLFVVMKSHATSSQNRCPPASPELAMAGRVAEIFRVEKDQVVVAGNKFAIKIRKRAHTPVLKEVEKLQKPFKVPWLSGKTVEIVRTA
jgi:hypothetical protein